MGKFALRLGRWCRLGASLVCGLWTLLPAELSAEQLLCAGQNQRAAKAVFEVPNGPSPTGRVDALVIFARFADEAEQGVPAYNTRLFDQGYRGSLAHFYQTMSVGQFSLQGSVLPRRYASRQAAVAYLTDEVDGYGRYGQFVQEILQGVDVDVDFAQYDNDGPDGLPNSGDDDGFVDYIFLNLLSAPPGFIFKGATGIAGLGIGPRYVSQDLGVNGAPILIAGSSAFGAVQQEGNFAQTVGSMAHEFGHALGLPDLYDTSYEVPDDDSAGIGHWGLMGWGAHGWDWLSGPVAFSAWSLEKLGWIGRGNSRLVELVGDRSGLSIEDLHEGGRIYRISLGAGSENGALFEEEYLLLEQRTRTYYNRQVPAEGLLVWHIRPQVQTNDREAYKLVDLVCADGLFRDAGYPQGRWPAALLGADNLDYWSHDSDYTAAHRGNLGDATDPFDGVRFTRLSMLSNPSSNLLGFSSAAFSGLELTLRRQGQAMVVDIVQQRWAGTVEEELHWVGNVLVDGDVRIGPQGALVIHQETNVQFSGRDITRSGQDPEQAELVVEGDLRIAERTGAESVVFEALDPGQSWYGIRIEPADSSRIEVPLNSYKVNGATYGIQLPGAPAGEDNRVTNKIQWVDTYGKRTAGNGDGRPDPGETFRLDVELANWTLSAHENVKVRLKWDSQLVYPAWSRANVKSVASEPFSFYPANKRHVELPSLLLSPGAKPGDKIEFSLEVGSAETVLEQTYEIQVEGQAPEFRAQFEVLGQRVHNHSVVVQAGWPTSYRALVGGQVRDAYLMVRSLYEGANIAVIPMGRRSRYGDEQVFQTAFLPQEVGPYQVFLRLHGPEGKVGFSQTGLNLWAGRSSRPTSALVFIGDRYDAGAKEALGASLTQHLERFGLVGNIQYTAPLEAATYQALLPYYLAEDKVVIWLGGAVDEEAQLVFRDFLQGGGRLLLVSYQFIRSPNINPFLREMVRISTGSRRGRRRSSTLNSLHLDEPIQFKVLHTEITPLAPAEAILRNGRSQVAGLRLDTGVYRLVYLPFDWRGLNAEAVDPLIFSSLEYLQLPAQVEAGKELTEQSAEAQLLSNYPNPFNAQTTISYRLGTETAVELSIYNVAGQRIRQLVDEVQVGGQYSVVWDGSDTMGRPVGSGVYFYRLVANGQRSRRLLVLK